VAGFSTNFASFVPPAGNNLDFYQFKVINLHCFSYCDVVVTACGRSFLAHKIVLAAASPYFDSIFRSDKVCREKV
jgi:hypothetical protein